MTKEEQDEINRNHERDKTLIVQNLKYPFWEVMGHYKMPMFNSNDVIIDIGANVGNFSITACMRGARNVIAYEPSRVAYESALRNIEAHGYSEYVKLHHLAVWKSSGNKLNYNLDFEKHETLTVSEERFKNNVEIDTISLDDILKDLKKVDFMKMDIEGAETDVIFSSKLLYEKTNQLSIECHRFTTSEHIELCKISPEEIFEYLLSLGYVGEHILTGNSGISFVYLEKIVK